VVVHDRDQGHLVMPRWYLALSLIVANTVGCSGSPQTASPAPASSRSVASGAEVVAPVLATEVVPDDPDDPAIWVHPTAPEKSLIFGTNKVAAPKGALVAFGLDGKIRQTIAGIDRPNNADVEYDIPIGQDSVDLLVTTERLAHRLRVFRIDRADGRLTELGVVPVLAGEDGERREPMGIGLYRRPTDRRLFAIVAPKLGGSTGYLWQYELTFSQAGRPSGRFVRRFGNFSGVGPEPGEAGEIEAVVVDDELGFVYFSDERFGIRKWHVDPEHADGDRELAAFGTSGYAADREGLAIYSTGPGRGYVLSVDQIEGGSVLKAYRREGEPGAPHDQSKLVFEVKTPADATDGIDTTSRALPGWPAGIVVMMNSASRNFLVFDWSRLAPASP
jgi:3-phytase